MTDHLHQPHNHLVRTVLHDVSQAASFLQAYLPPRVRDALQWDTLTLLESSFTDDHLRGTEADFLYEVERMEGEEAEPVWIYVLLEHQSTPDSWMPFRLLKYCCRIWDNSFRDHPHQRQLRAIVPLVLYQGPQPWSYSTEFADLFAESVRGWPGIPRFAYELLDQSQMEPQSVEGDLVARLMQWALMAVFHPEREWAAWLPRGLAELSRQESGGGLDYVAIFMLYLLRMLPSEQVAVFRETWREQGFERGEEWMATYGEQLRAEGRSEGEAKGRAKERVEMIEGLLREGLGWPVIERATRVSEVQFQQLKAQVEAMKA